jgi:pyruvate kinase
LDEQGQVVRPAAIGATLPEIFCGRAERENIWFDDGKIGGHYVGRENEIASDIAKSPAQRGELWADKGINLPDSELRVPALTREDIALLPFIARHADLIGYSFVRQPADIHLLHGNWPVSAEAPGNHSQNRNPQGL